jgi:acyl-CoA synthetase (AMP-forming)/AMP-acid ligase II
VAISTRYSQVARSVDRLCHHYKSLQPQADGDDVPPERIVAVLTSTAIDESLLEIALAKLGLAALLLSVNNSTAAVAHLVKQTEASHLIFGPKFEQTAKDAQKALKEEGVEVEVVPEKRFPLWGEGGIDETKVEPLQPRLTPEQEAKRTCVILHSSGSTGFPKPVYITHYGLIANVSGSAPVHVRIRVCSPGYPSAIQCASSLPKTGFSALPLFHGFGHFSMSVLVPGSHNEYVGYSDRVFPPFSQLSVLLPRKNIHSLPPSHPPNIFQHRPDHILFPNSS